MVEESQVAIGHLQRAEKYFIVYFIYMFLIHACFQLEPTFPTIPSFLLLFGPSQSQLRPTFS